ncbi:MAG: DUF4465 domain-containing protein [Alistipes sp.]|nr:DUF4465 domain-containing protein [Alistipes sp.]
MRKTFLILITAALLAGCNNDGGDDNRIRKHYTADFEDSSYSTGDTENPGNTVTNRWWASLIDSKQYGGPLLYGEPDGQGFYLGNPDKPYAWYDIRTDLWSELVGAFDNYTFSGGGIAVSNYNPDGSVANGHYTYEQQLTADRAHSGNNFLVCYVASNDVPPFIEFKYSTGIIEHIYILGTRYTLDVLQNGYAGPGYQIPALPKDGYMKVIATGYDANGATTGSVETYIKRTEVSTLASWRKWDLSPLGEVKGVRFTMEEGTIVNGECVKSELPYLNYPTYLAMDDIQVYK